MSNMEGMQRQEQSQATCVHRYKSVRMVQYAHWIILSRPSEPLGADSTSCPTVKSRVKKNRRKLCDVISFDKNRGSYGVGRYVHSQVGRFHCNSAGNISGVSHLSHGEE